MWRIDGGGKKGDRRRASSEGMRARRNIVGCGHLREALCGFVLWMLLAQLPVVFSCTALSAQEPRSTAQSVGSESGQSFTEAGAEPLGVLLLRNGNLFRGRISHVGDRYSVLLAANTEVRFAASDVAFHGATLDDAYRFKRSQLPPGKVDARLDLAEWCLRHSLLRQAAEETTIALRLEPSHPRIPGLEARIDAFMSRSSTTTSGTRTTLVPGENGSQRTAAATGRKAEIGGELAASRGPVAETPATIEQLESMARELPTGTLERFTSVVQPMLVNRCGANNCHGPSGNTDYRLLRLSLGANATRRYTLRNLHATLRHIDRDASSDSALLTMAASPHGGSAAAPLPASDAGQVTLLRNWVQLAAQSRTSPAPARIASGDSRPLQSLPAPTWNGTFESDYGKAALARDTSSKGGATASVADSANDRNSIHEASTADATRVPLSRSTVAPPVGASTVGAAPVINVDARDVGMAVPGDPFDPEIFNRRFGTAKPPPQERSTGPSASDR